MSESMSSLVLNELWGRRRFTGLIFFLFFFVVLGLEFRAYTLSHSTSPFFVIFFFFRYGLTNYLPVLALP
jgi:hypothetical protein